MDALIKWGINSWMHWLKWALIRGRIDADDAADPSRSLEYIDVWCGGLSGRRAPIRGTLLFVRALVTVTSTTRWRCGAMKSNQAMSLGRSRDASDRIRRTSNRKSRPLVPPASSMKSSSTWTIRSWSWMTHQEHGHRGMLSISIADVERSPDIEVPDTVDEDPYPLDSEGASLHRGHFRTWQARSAMRQSTPCATMT
jgi:hypothetical protein